MTDDNVRQESDALDEFNGPLRQAIAELRTRAPRSESLARIVDWATQLPTAQPTMRRSRRWMGYCITMAAAAIILIAAPVWLFAPSDGWAQVVRAVQVKPWIHGVVQLPGGRRRETWISCTREVAAVRRGDWTIFEDFKSKVRFEFRPEEGKGGTLYRGPVLSTDAEGVQRIQEMFLAAMRGDRALQPAFASGAEIKSHETRTVVENGKNWTEYDFTFSGVAPGQTEQLVFRVDPATNLPASLRIFALSGNANSGQETAFDYPDENAGPRDIYDLGVARTTKLVDWMASAKLAEVNSVVRAGQRKFGPYFAIVVTGVGRNPKPWDAVQVELVWRKGKKFRLESVILRPSDPAPDPPAAGADMVAWWKNRLKTELIAPQRACDGEVIWIAEPVEKKITPATHSIKSTWRLYGNVRGDSDDLSALLSCVSTGSVPDIMAYGYPPRPSLYDDLGLANNSSDGPAGCIVVESHHTRESPGAYHLNRYWYDPAHTYVMRRFEMSDLRPANDARATDAYDAESIAETPSGVWYPTCVRRRYPKLDGNKNLIWYFVDFDAKLPDSLFKPEARTGDIE
jgi:hypothetical protein